MITMYLVAGAVALFSAALGFAVMAKLGFRGRRATALVVELMLFGFLLGTVPFEPIGRYSIASFIYYLVLLSIVPQAIIFWPRRQKSERIESEN